MNADRAGPGRVADDRVVGRNAVDGSAIVERSDGERRAADFSAVDRGADDGAVERGAVGGSVIVDRSAGDRSASHRPVDDRAADDCTVERGAIDVSAIIDRSAGDRSAGDCSASDRVDDRVVDRGAGDSRAVDGVAVVDRRAGDRSAADCSVADGSIVDGGDEGAFARVRFVLVAPAHAGNIGAAARAIRTMGFRRLEVVSPREDAFADHPEALAFATHAAEVLRAAGRHESLPQALAGVRLSFAMTGYAREFGPPLLDLRQAAARAAALLRAGPGEVAFVFGPERSGLSNEDVERCSACCAIAADPAAASLNLSQAVQVAAYECRLALAGGAIDARLAPFADAPPASHERVEAMFAHLEQALVAIGYLDPAQPKRLMSRLRRLLARAQPSDAEVDILRGIAASIVARRSERAGRKQSRR